MSAFNIVFRFALFSSLVVVTGCDDPHDHGGNENEVITTVSVTFTPSGGGAAQIFEFNDPDGDGGDAPIVDAIDIGPGDYGVAVSFENRLEDPPEDITEEIMDEADERRRNG